VILTNKHNLPQALVNALQNDSHRGAEYTASGMNKPVRMHWLTRRYEATRDVSDMIWMLFGTAVHSVIERAEHADQLIEQYLSIEVAGHKVSGIADVYDNGIIQDWKTTSVWNYMYLNEQKIFEYESQLNAYAEMYRQAGFGVNGLQIVQLFRDWQAGKAKYEKDYPQSQVAVIDLRLWSSVETLDYLSRRISGYELFRHMPDDGLPLCTAEERWVKPAKWAVMKKGRKSAIKLYDEQSHAEMHATGLGAGHYTEERPGEQWKRCEYCDAMEHCNQYRDGLL